MGLRLQATNLEESINKAYNTVGTSIENVMDLVIEIILLL